MKFEVKNRFSGEVQFTADIECDESENPSFKLGLSVKWAIKNNINLRGANLRGANLSVANLSVADLSGAYLSGAYLSGADLSGANLIGANLRGANLRGANLRGANLSGANLSGAYLSGADLRVFKHDLWGILLRFKNEIPALIDYINKGKIDGSCYSGECSCLMGTFATIKNSDIRDDQFSIKNSSSPAEQWFSMIKPGDTPENNFASKKAVEWIEEFLMLDKVNNA